MNLSTEQCQYLIDLCETIGGWKRKRFSPNTSYRTVPVNLGGANDIKDLIVDYCKKYLDLDIISVNLGVIKYLPGDAFDRHRDDGIHKFSEDFMFNINVILNNDYEGGDFFLNDIPHVRPMGEIYHYKSNEYHGVTEITKGVRYSALFYVRYRDIKKESNSIKLI